MARESDIHGILPSKITLVPGATNAILVDQIGGEGALILKYFSGGSLEILQAPVGTTHTGATLAALSGTGYLMGTSEVINIAGPARFYLAAYGATTVAMVLKGLTGGF